MTAHAAAALNDTSPGAGFAYAPERMYGVRTGFRDSSRFLGGRPPAVLSLAALTALSLQYRPFSGPRAQSPQLELRLSNPSLARAPPNLCPRCAYVTTVRADTLHQCDATSPLYWTRPKKMQALADPFKGTALIVLDDELRALGWTWLLSQPFKQTAHPDDAGRGARWQVPVGSTDAFDPPWAQPTVDARLLNLDGRHLLVTYICKACDFSVSQLSLTAEPTPDGGLRRLRAWCPKRAVSKASWLRGRNQALFAVPAAVGGGVEVGVQPWLGVVGSLGAPRFVPDDARPCYAGYEGMRGSV